MSTHRSSIRLPARGWWRAGPGLLALFWLAACGVAEQPAAGVAPTVVESQPQAATAERVSSAATVAPESIGAVDMREFATTGVLAAQRTYPIPLITPAGEASMNEPTGQNTPQVPVPTDASAWQSYRNEQAGYSVEYPSGWTVSEKNWGNGTFGVTFAPGGGSSITVVTQAGEILLESGEVPNMPCETTVVAGLPARRCTDTISFTTSTTIAGQGKTYIIATSTKHMNKDVYQHFLDSFTIVS